MSVRLGEPSSAARGVVSTGFPTQMSVRLGKKDPCIPARDEGCNSGSRIVWKAGESRKGALAVELTGRYFSHLRGEVV